MIQIDKELVANLDLRSDDDGVNESAPVASNIATIDDSTSKHKNKFTSLVYQFFQINDAIKKRKCIKCGMEYHFGGKIGIENLKRHIENCKKNHDVGQMILSQSQGSISMQSSKFNPEKIYEWLIYAIIKHDLPIQFVEYEDIRSLFVYVCEDVKLVSKNTVKTDMLKLYI